MNSLTTAGVRLGRVIYGATASRFTFNTINGAARRYYRCSPHYLNRVTGIKKFDPLVSGPQPSPAGSPLGHSGGHSIGFGGYFLLIIPVSTFCLGVWQVYRWFWKLELIATMEKKTSETLPFSSVRLEELDDYEYKTVIVKGTFIPGDEVLMGPRSLQAKSKSISQESHGGGGMITHGQSQTGYHIITPFKVADQDITLLVNRGWIPSKHMDKFKIDPSSNSEIEITGVIRKGEKRAPFMSKTQPGSKLWLYRDVSAMAKKLGTSEIFVDLSSSIGRGPQTNVNNLPIPGQTRVSLRNEHVSYFLTWFSLSGITSYLWFRQFKQRLPLK